MEHVFVAMSGGVDSAGAALLLRKAGYRVSGVTMQLQSCPASAEREASELAAAAKVAQSLEIPHTVLDLRQTFQTAVMDPFVAAYQQGLTPNPCILCNRELKLGALLDWVLQQGGDKLATGHYAKIRYDEPSGRWQLLRGEDRSKDQTYVLYRLTQHQLSHLLLPVGTYDKATLRRMAGQAGLANAEKSDSQDICFIPSGDYVAFLQDYGGVELQPGDFVDQAGRVVGHHRGLECYTTGQRKGLGVSLGVPAYVLEKDAEANRVVLGPNEALFRRDLVATEPNWISIPELTAPLRVTAKTRYSQREAAATVTPLAEGRVHVAFDEPQRAITAGQAVVFYAGEVVVGGATIIESRE